MSAKNRLKGGERSYDQAMIEEGTPAPDFELPSDEGTTVRLSELHGRPVVLYFYPKDDTPGCTKQACGYRDIYDQLEDRGAVVVGVSPDNVASHQRFKQKHALPFTLLADPDHTVAETYGVWAERKIRGRTSMGIKRSTFVIDAGGNVVRAMYGVNPERDPAQVLEALG
jgi:peroxiredoxin Q/BCP